MRIKNKELKKAVDELKGTFHQIYSTSLKIKQIKLVTKEYDKTIKLQEASSIINVRLNEAQRKLELAIEIKDKVTEMLDKEGNNE